MDILQIASATFYATGMMTLFSYVLSLIVRSDFREPEILGILSCRLFLHKQHVLHGIIGWLLHILAGFVFVLVYIMLWDRHIMPATMLNGVAIGAVSGVAAIGIWKLVFTIHPDPPLLNYKGYYANLFFAHIVFGLFAVIGYNLTA
jgi:hypothetical protein